MILSTSVPPETSAFLGLVAICMVGLLVLYLYLSRKVCFSNVGHFPCCDEPTKTEKCKITRQLGSSYGYGQGDDDERESSTDSEKDVMERLFQPEPESPHGPPVQPPKRQSTDKRQHRKQQLAASNNHRNNNNYHHHNHPHQHQFHYNKPSHLWSNENKNYIKQSNSRDQLLERNDSVQSDKTDTSSLYHPEPPVKGRPVFEQRNFYNQNYECDREQGKSMEVKKKGPEFGGPGNKNNRVDLISMAERGKIGKTGSSDAASSTSESGSQDTEEEALVPFLHEKAKQKASKLKGGALNGVDHSGGANKRIKMGPDKETESYFNEGFEDRLDGENTKSSEDEEEVALSRNGIIKCGCLQVSHAYDPPTRKLRVTVIRAKSIPTKERSGSNQVYVKVVLAPNRKSKQATKPKPTGTGDPEFNESFTFNRIDPEEILNHGIRYRLYTYERMRRDHLIGECYVSFATHKPLQQETRIWLTLEPRTNIVKAESRSDVSSLARSDSSGSNNSDNACSPELLLGLSYNGTTGRLQVIVIRGSQFKSAAMSRAPDTYVKLALVSSSGQEIARSKTSVRRGQPNPVFKETFLFQVALFQLPDVTLLVSVYNKRSMNRKEMIGWFSLGRNSTGEEEKSHWNDMKDTRGEQISRWHVLLDS